MRNLSLLYHRFTQLPVAQARAFSLDTIQSNQCYGMCNDRLFAATDSGVSREFEFQFPDLEELRGFEYLALNDEFCLARQSSLVVYNPQAAREESVAFFEANVACMAWSPDQEIVAVVTEDLRCIVMNSVYDILTDTNLTESGFGEDEFVNVGWGKKETQFHGSEGKQAARKTVETGVPITEAVDSRCEISWRGDGSYFAVIFSFESKRLFKVFDKEGQLKFTSERCHGLDGPMAWRPSGLWIAVPQLLIDEQYCIALFERNGLRHRELVLPFRRSAELVINLSWSLDSDILTIVTKCVETNRHKIYLYTINNYHWYLKQSLSFNSSVDYLKWDPHPVNGKTLHVFLANGEYHKFKWCFTVTGSRGTSVADEAIVAVIDGSDLLLTNFRSFVIPPPMSSFKLTIAEKINGVGFVHDRPERDSNRLFIVTDTNKLRIYGCLFESLNNQVTRKIKEVNLLEEIEIPDDGRMSYNWRLIDERTVLYATGETIHLVNSNGQRDELLLKDQHNIALELIDPHSILVGSTDGSMMKIPIDLPSCKFQSSSPEKLFDLPRTCESHEIFTTSAGEATIFSLNPGEMLYRNGENYLEDITSMSRVGGGSYLAVTTIDELKFISISDKNSSTSERKIERGGSLIIIVPHDSRTVLQMPRGNLETIKPRTLSVAIAGRLLDQCEYSKCYDVLRRERINLNLIVDHNPDKFFANMGEFIQQVANANWMNLFLAELRNEDVTQTIYPQQYANSTSECATPGYKPTGKVEFICRRFCELMEAERRFGEAAWLTLPKITSYVKRGDLETALGLIWELKRGESDLATPEITADDALKYLLYLVNVDELFNVALGMYDFDLVLFVARKSQKDPKEYLPFMNGLKQLEETYRKFQIDLHLKRFKKAVTNGIECCADEKFEECLAVIKAHDLHGHAMDLLAAGAGGRADERYRKIAIQYGGHLREKGRLKEAGFVYEKGGDLGAALSCAQTSLQWERCVSLKRRMGADEEEVKCLAEIMVTQLADKGHHSEAVQLCSTVLRDSELLLNLLVQGNLYERAAYEARSEEDLILIKEAFNGHFNSVVTALEEDASLFGKQKLRLLQVRKEKAQNLLLNREENEYDLECDLYSDTTSLRSSQHTGRTRSTGKSFRSSKNRRKHERKLLNLKEGNVFEDIALIDALHGLVLKIYNQQTVVRETLQAAVALDLIPEGRKLQRFYKTTLEEVRNSLDEIWISEMIVSEQIVLDDEMDLAQLQKGQHFALIKPHQRYKPQLISVEWEFEILK